MPFAEISVRPSADNLKIAPLALSVKYDLKPNDAKDSGFLDIPYSPANGIACPKTVLVLVKLALPSALKSASLLANIRKHLSSHNVKRSP